MDDVARGNLTRTFDLKIRKGEIGRLASSVNVMILKLREMIGQIQHASREVAHSSEMMGQSVSQSIGMGSRIHKATDDVASGTTIQATSAQETSLAMAEMTSGIQKIADSSSSVSELAQTASVELTKGEQTVDDAISQMHIISERVDFSAGLIRRMEELSQEIEMVLSFITEISDQTQLLSLNASIEAARVGEQGSGFAVVAGEIKKMAEQSKQSAYQIAEIIHRIHSITNQTVESMVQGVDEAAKGVRLIETTGVSMNVILESVKEVLGQIQEVSAAAEEISAGTEEVTASMEEIARVSALSKSNSDQVLNSVHEQITTLDKVDHSSKSLQVLAVELKKMIDQFHL
jgi:methyl-accepting chemotaxis protein